MAKRLVEVELIWDAQGAVAGIRTADGELLKLKQTTEDVDDRTRKLSTSMKAGLAVALVGVGAAAAKGFQELSRSVQLAGVQEISERKLEQALANLGDTSGASAEMLKRVASEVQGFSNFGDEAIITAQAMLLSFQEVAGAEGAALLTPRLADLAAGVAKATGETIDLNQAATALGKALSSGAGSLKEYGISLTKAQEEAFNTATGLDRVRIATEILDGNFRGLAAATADPFVQMNNALDDLREQVGSAVRVELTQLADKTKEISQDPATVNFARSTGVAIATVIKWALQLVEVFGHMSNIIRAAIRVGVISFREFQQVVNGVAQNVVGAMATLADAVGLDSLAEKMRGLTRELEIRETVREAQIAGEYRLIGNILTGADALEKQTQALTANTAATVANTTAKNVPVRPAIEETRRTDIILEADPLELGNPLEVFDTGSIGAVEEAIASLNDQLLRVGNQEARNGIMAQIESLEMLRDTMVGVTDTTATAEAQFTQMVATAQLDFRNLGQSVMDFTLGFIQAKLVEAMAAAIAREFATKGLIGAITGGLAIGAVNGAFALIRSKIPKFNTGVEGFGGGLAIVGDDPRRGGSGELVSLPRGSDVYSASDTRNILTNLSRLQDRAPVSSDAAINRQTEVLTASLQGLGDRISTIEARVSLYDLDTNLEHYRRGRRAQGNRG
jgi:hypothetical protein